MKRVLIFFIRLYQRYLSPLKKQPTCRFTPTCSAYAIEALQKRGAIVGSVLAILRILRCQPFGPCGWDPVPEKGFRNRRSIGKPITKYYYPEDDPLDEQTDADASEMTSQDQ